MAILRAKEPFSYFDGSGVPRVVRPGDLFESTDPALKGRGHLFESTDPALKGRGHLFESVEVGAERRRSTVEDASAAPGEKRSVGAPRKAPAKKAAPEPADSAEGDG